MDRRGFIGRLAGAVAAVVGAGAVAKAVKPEDGVELIVRTSKYDPSKPKETIGWTATVKPNCMIDGKPAYRTDPLRQRESVHWKPPAKCKVVVNKDFADRVEEMIDNGMTSCDRMLIGMDNSDTKCLSIDYSEYEDRPTIASLDAYNSLISKGCTLIGPYPGFDEMIEEIDAESKVNGKINYNGIYHLGEGDDVSEYDIFLPKDERIQFYKDGVEYIVCNNFDTDIGINIDDYVMHHKSDPFPALDLTKLNEINQLTSLTCSDNNISTLDVSKCDIPMFDLSKFNHESNDGWITWYTKAKESNGS